MRINFKILLRIQLIIILLLGILSALNCSTGRSQIRIDNLGNTRLESVIISVRERRYEIGNIESNDSASLIIEPGGESELEIELRFGKGETKKLKPDFNLESGYIGFVLIRIKDDSIVHEEKDYESLWFP